MKRLFSLVLVALLVVCVFCPLASSASALQTVKTVRIGYIQSEPYDQFAFELAGIARGLYHLGILRNLPNLSDEKDAHAIWERICANQASPLARFESGAYYDMSTASESELGDALSGKTADLFIVMGTVAGVYLTKNNPNVDYMVFASGDPISAGIAKSATERVNNRSFAHIDPSRYVRQIQAAYNLLGFHDVGVVYQDTPQAYSYSGIAQLERASKEFGFTIHALYVDEPASPEDFSRYYVELKQAYETLIPQIDALYITTASIEDEKLPWLLQDVHKAGIYTIAQSSERQVEFGALMNVSINNAQEEGLFGAQRIVEYLGGTPISQLDQVFESTPKLALNYKTAQELKLNIPFRSLLVFDTIYAGGEQP